MRVARPTNYIIANKNTMNLNLNTKMTEHEQYLICNFLLMCKNHKYFDINAKDNPGHKHDASQAFKKDMERADIISSPKVKEYEYLTDNILDIADGKILVKTYKDRRRAHI